MKHSYFYYLGNFTMLITIFFGFEKAYSQKHDLNRLQTIFTWDGNYGVAKIEVDSIRDTIMYGPILTKNYLPFQNNICMNDSSGNFIFGSNCIEVFDRNFNMMLFGDSLSKIGPYSDKTVYPPQDNVQYGYPSGFINPIPLPGKQNEYVFFHTTWYFDELRRYSQALHYCRVDMNKENGVVVEKNELIHANATDKPILIKHGNGVDWWLISANRWNTDIYIYLINSQGIIGPKIKKVGTAADSSKWYQLTYNHNRLSASPDGEMIASQKTSYVDFFKFDRCTGGISMMQKVTQFEFVSSLMYINAFEWSHNSSNYFYSIGSELFQINIEKHDKISTPRKVGQVTSPYFIRFFNRIFNKMILGQFPSFGVPPFLGLISDSELPGAKPQLSSNLFNNYPTHSPSGNFGVLPNMPNYYLGKVNASDVCKEDAYFKNALMPNEPFIKDGKQYSKLLRKFE